MPRDWDLIREILLAIESIAESGGTLSSDEFARERQVASSLAYHQFEIMLERGLIVGRDVSSSDAFAILASAMTWEGHELLDRMRGSVLWNDIKAEAKKRDIGLSFEAIGVLSTRVMAAALNDI
jgi:Hypothetical protein (DUF2513)